MAQLLVFPIGRAWVRVVPTKSIFGIQLNPGPFSIKEHVRSLYERRTFFAETTDGFASMTGTRYRDGYRRRSERLRHRHNRRPKGLLQAKTALYLQLDVGYVDAVDRIFHWRDCSTVPGRSRFNE